MALIQIAACAGPRQVIGHRGKLPWHFPSDLKFFKDTTRGHPILMGRKTFDAVLAQFGRPLPDRQHLIVSRDPTYVPITGKVYGDIDTALAAIAPDQDIFVIGGQQIYEQTLSRTDRVLLTKIDRDYVGDAFFPPLDPTVWRLDAERLETDHGVTLHFCSYGRR